jgi:hypothetical protein
MFRYYCFYMKKFRNLFDDYVLFSTNIENISLIVSALIICDEWTFAIIARAVTNARVNTSVKSLQVK